MALCASVEYFVIQKTVISSLVDYMVEVVNNKKTH